MDPGLTRRRRRRGRLAIVARSELVVDVRGLLKVYGSRGSYHRALDGLDLVVPYGGVHAFLGPNGSGKTTTIRILLGLTRADGGSVALMGASVPAGLSSVMSQVGAIVESPRFFGGFTARQTLGLLADAAGAPRARVDESLDRVGLLDRGNDRVSDYSLGMRQRLAIATTLLKNPRLFVFDEPTNGLDPEGIHEVRQTIRRLGDEGHTVLLSSHLLSEVEHLAHRVTVISHGRAVRSGALCDLLVGDPGISVDIAQVDHATAALVAAGFAVRRSGPRSLVATGPEASAPSVGRALATHDLWPDSIGPHRPDLEQAYLSLTGADR